MNKYSFKINKRIIGLNYKPFIVAEMSGNHNGSLERALKIIDKAVSKNLIHRNTGARRKSQITRHINSLT